MVTLSALSSYLPFPLAAQILQDPAGPLMEQRARFEAAILFIDLVGFTPLTEALGRVGPEGAEELTRILNSRFTPLIEEIHHWGGIVAKFAGDAMVLFFHDEGAISRSLACALALRQQIIRLAHVTTQAGDFVLRMRLGLAAGPVLQTVVGTAQRAEFVLAGLPLEEAADAEERAAPNEIVLHPGLVGRLSPEETKGTALADGYMRLQDLLGEATPRPHPPLPETPDEDQAIQTLGPFLNPQVFGRLLSNQEAFVNEHRRITALFVGFEGIDYQAPGAEGLLGEYVRQACAIIDRFDGYLCRVDMGDKGSRLLILFGAPVAHENDEERALLCALALQSLTRSLEAISSQQVGINSGRAFVGNVGSPTRQEYTAMGDTVNLAARFMQAAAPDQILVGVNTYQPAAEAFVWMPLPPVRVKGKSTPVTVYELIERPTCQALRLQEPSYALPMVGREAELAGLEALLAGVKETGRGHVVGITAEAGMGKSRLAAEVIVRALQMGFLGLGGNGVSHGTTTPYLAWRPLLRGLLELEEGWSHNRQVAASRQRLARIDPDLALRLPLLGDALGLELPDNELTASFDADLRRRSLFSLVTDLVRDYARRAPLLLVLEDAHWIDDLSRELAGYVGREIVDLPIFLLSVYRPLEIEGVPPLWDLALDHVSEINLGPFSPEESAELIRLKLAGRELPAALAEQIGQRAQGNPFFVDEFVNLIQDRGLDLDNGDALAGIEVPDSLQTLIVSRLDQLNKSEQMTIRVASVIGRLFRAHWLLAIYPGGIEEESLRRDLDSLSALGLVPLDKVEPEREYLFKHAVTQEVAYRTLAFANRRMLHGRVAAYIEESYQEDPGAWYGILVHHYRRAEQAAKEFEYLQLAARQAARQAAHRQAAAFYNRALALLEKVIQDPDELREQRYALLLGREEAHGMLGDREAQYADLNALVALAEETAGGLPEASTIGSHRAEVALRQAAYYEATSDFPTAFEMAQQAVERADQAGDARRKVLGLIAGARALWRQGKFEQASQLLELALALAQYSEDPSGEATSLHYLGTVLYFLGKHQEARDYLEQALAIRRDLGDRRGEAISLNNLVGVCDGLGDFARGKEFSEQALTIYRAVGDRRHEAQALSNLGSIHFALGDFEAARDYHQRSLDIQRTTGDRRGEALVSKNLGLVLHVLGDHQVGRDYCRQALEIDRATGDRLGEGYALTYMALALEGLEDWESAADAYEQALTLRREIGQAARAVDDLAGLARVALKQGQIEPALAYAEEALAWIEEQGVAGIEYPLQVYLTVVDVLTRAGQPERAAAVLEQAYTLLQERAARISDPAARRSFLENVPLHNEIVTRFSLEK